MLKPGEFWCICPVCEDPQYTIRMFACYEQGGTWDEIGIDWDVREKSCSCELDDDTFVELAREGLENW